MAFTPPTKFERIIATLPHSTLYLLQDKSYLRGLLDQYYSEPWRTYHNWDHVLDMIIRIKYRTTLYLDELIIAAIFHDAIYTPASPAGWNENQSAELAMKYGPEVFSSPIGQRINWKLVHQLISATVHNGELKKHPYEIPIFVDLDMSCFGGTQKHCFEASDKIIQEYEQFYPFPRVVHGRIDFLRKLLAKPFIYYNDWDDSFNPDRTIPDYVFFTNERAKLNVQADIDRLEQKMADIE